ncbi:hypothetical protein OL599_16465 [Rhodovastum sp. RN2-1]|uniref:Right handed beta helix domain-containing protein n=1 Tax=Limobrevibacterium gyesilva TaxID=2991712 RepID=A0AA41YLP7_9PROT|nr:hypothetical protein [Limobrevibacterium gyesilva]
MVARAVLLPVLLLAAGAARAATLEVGPQRAFQQPSAALLKADDGDTIAIDPGDYFDCLRVRVNRLTIVGSGPGVVLTDTACDGKALIVAAADDLVLRNLTLQRVRVPDGNGAGIRAEGRNLTVDHVRFINNQSGIITTDSPDSVIRITDSTFTDNGVCNGPRCAHALVFGAVARVRIEKSVITGTRGAHQIVTSARLTELQGDRIEDGEKGSASFQVLVPSGGSLVMEDCVVQKGPNAANTRAAVMLDGEVTGKLVFRRNRFINDTGTPMPFIRNWTNYAPVMDANVIAAGDSDVSSGGWLANRGWAVLSQVKRTVGKVIDLGKRVAHKVLPI